MNSEIRDIKGLVPLPGHWWLWLGLILAVTALGGLVYWFWRSHKRLPVVRATPPQSPYDRAVQSLRALLAESLMERGLVDEFYTRLSDIVRHYLEGRFQLRAPELTTEEFLHEVARDASLRQEHKDLLGAFLQESDLVKFARLRPAELDMKRAFDAAEQFVHDTRPRLREEAAERRGSVERAGVEA